MKILITGSEGFVGTHLTKELQNKHTVISFDLKSGKDVLNEKQLRKFMKNIDVVIHLAAYISSSDSWNKPQKYLNNNGFGTYQTLKIATESKVKRFILFSSAAVYGGPLNPYGLSKIWAEEATKVFKDNLEIIILRPFNIYGKGQNSSYGYVIHNFIEGIKDKGKIRIFGDGNQTRDFIAVEDVVKVVKKCLLIKSLPSKPVDLGTGKAITISNLAKIIGEILNREFKIEYCPSQVEPYRSKANIIVLANLGIYVNRFITLKEGIGRLLK